VSLDMSAMDFFVMWGAGHDTTRNSLGWGMYAFCQYPDQYQKVREDPSLLDGPAVAEILRWASPVHQFRRHVTRDVELSGVRLTRGQDVIIWYSSGNRDEEVFDDPYTFDVTRASNPHMAFGGGGPHMCIGQYLAKLELKLVFNELIKRIPQPELAGEPVRFKDNFLRGLTTLPIDVT
jgi:cytochrome P450